MSNIAAYLRVSTKVQSFENQLPIIQNYCKAHNWPDPVIYSESESGWKAGHQAELSRLLNDIRRGKRKYDYLVVFALDRLSRQGATVILNIIHDLKNYGIKVVSISEPFTDLPYGFDDVLYAFLGWAAKVESDRKSQNTRAGLDRARANGVKLGRPKGKKDGQPRRKKRPVVFKYSGEAKSRELLTV